MGNLSFFGPTEPEEEPEWECIECGGVVVRNGKDCTKCLDCEKEWEPDVEPSGPDY